MTPTIPNIPPKLASLRRSPIPPLIVLLLTLSGVFLFSGDERGKFYRYGPHGGNSGNYMAIIANISLEDRFLGYYHERLVSDDGRTHYELYNRFPVGGFVLTKLATLPFGSLSAQLYAAQAAMLLFYTAAALMAYLALSRLTRRPWIALTAVLLAFSSYYLLYYSDMICTETSPSLFGVMLAFHGMVVFAQERRFPQLLLKSCAALLLGWHVYALLLPFIIIGLTADLITALRSPTAAAPLLPYQSLLSRARRLPPALLRSRCLLLGVATLAFGASLLSFNLTNEYRAFDGRVAFTELPSYTSMIRRGTGNRNEAFEEFLGAPLNEIWPLSRVIEQQFHRIGIISAPYALPGYATARDIEFWHHWVIIGIAVAAACCIGIAVARHKTLWATLAFYGFFWAIPFRYNVVFHEFEAMHHIGMPLTLFAFALLWIRRQSNDRLMLLAAALAVVIFVFAASQIAQLSIPPRDQARHAQTLADFDAIRPIVDGKIVYIPPPFRNNTAIGGRYSEDFYLSGRLLIVDGSLRENADYFITNRRLPATETLTPKNREVFLYRQTDFPRWYQNALANAAGPLARENFNVYTHENAVLFAKQDCNQADFESRFILHIFPSDPEDLPLIRRQHSFENLDFYFERRGVRLGDDCFASIDLPRYPIQTIRAGQRSIAGGIRWLTDIPLALHRSLYREEDFAHWHETALANAAGPFIRENFDVYTREDAILFSKQDCSAQDAKARLILHIFPTDLAALPTARKQHGFANLDFRFDRRGIRLTDDCLASIPLPNYPIDTIRVGQKNSAGNILWQTDIPLALHRSLYRQADFPHWYESALTNATGPIARENFNIHLRQNAILFGKQNCAEQDFNARLILHIIPINSEDIPAARQQHGFANLDFRFDRNGIRLSNNCLASIPLPTYPIAAIRAGQKTPDAETLWQTNIPLAQTPDDAPIPFDIQQFLAAPGEPIAQSDFNIHLRENLIIYHKPDCRAEHTEPRFLLHIIPADPAALPAAPAETTFANLDFNFANNGVWSASGCAAFAQLPTYPIATIRAGQHTHGKALWRVEFTP